MTDQYDVIIIGAGSIGIPTALACAHDGLKTLVLDKEASVSQGENKHAIGGIRATHTQKAKIYLCQRSIEIFSSWEEKYGDDIGWRQGGYVYVAYTPEHKELFQNNVKLQKSYGLNINFESPDIIQELIPGINPNGLLGGTYSPEDGSASPLLAANAFYHQALKEGADFQFNEIVEDIIVEENKIIGVRTNKTTYKTTHVINAAGAYGKNIGQMVNIDLPINPTSHEAAITEPVKIFMKPMVVNIRPGKDTHFGNSNNFYYYQNNEGQIIFCITPNPPYYGFNSEETSVFLPQVAKRMIELQPRLKNIKIRRTWRGLYPDTPDGAPIIGKVKEVKGFINAAGPCGQGYMLGPGVGELLSRVIRDQVTEKDQVILDELSLYRNFEQEEMLK